MDVEMIPKRIKIALENYSDNIMNVEIKPYNKSVIHFKCNKCGGFFKKTIKKEFKPYCRKCSYEKIFLEKYGVDNPMKYSPISRKVNENRKNTFLAKYNVHCTFNVPSLLEKTKETKKRIYGYECVTKNETIKNKIKVKLQNRSLTEKEIAKYKRKGTSLMKYGVDNPSKSPLIYNKIVKKGIATKKANHSFNKSSIEETVYNMLLERYDDVRRQYDNERYPFPCDFYIPCKDLFIECNFHWTHGKIAFNPNNTSHLEKLHKWREKAESNKYYKIAIDTWTVRDVNKRQIALNNNLNYKEIFSKSEIASLI